MKTADYLRDLVFPAAFALLPAKMDTPAARALLLTIALQESRCCTRYQFGGGPARGFFQFETGGIAGVVTHRASKSHLEAVCQTLLYPPAVSALYAAIEHNDVLATVCARLLLWTDAKPLPDPQDPQAAWEMYLRTWRPGKPRRASWDGFYFEAWNAFLPLVIGL